MAEKHHRYTTLGRYREPSANSPGRSFVDPASFPLTDLAHPEIPPRLPEPRGFGIFCAFDDLVHCHDVIGDVAVVLNQLLSNTVGDHKVANDAAAATTVTAAHWQGENTLQRRLRDRETNRGIVRNHVNRVCSRAPERSRERHDDACRIDRRLRDSSQEHEARSISRPRRVGGGITRV